MKRVLFGLNQSSNKDVENKIREKYIETVGESFEFDSEYYLAGIWRALSEKEYDILIFKEDLEGSSVKIQYLDDITDKYPNLEIIFVINDEHERDNYVKQLFNMGLYNILYKEDLKLSNIIELMQRPRGKMDAKIYLDIDEIEAISKDSNMETINDRELEVILLNLKSATVENISPMFDEISKSDYNDKQMLFLISILPNDIKDKLFKSGNENFDKYYKRWLILDDKYSELEATQTTKEIIKTKTITKIEKEYIHSIPSDYNKIVAFVGDRQVGTTTIVDFVAKAFVKKGKKVAVLDLTTNKTMYYMKCWGDTTISKKEKKALEYLNKGENLPIIVGENYKLYTYIEDEGNDGTDYEFDFFQAIEQIRYDSDIILIDMDFNTPSEWLKYGVTSVYLVNDLNILNMITVKNYVRELFKKGVNNKKVNLIVNKYIKARVKPEDILASINQPIPYLEYESDTNCLDINKKIFKIDLEMETYTNLVSSYLFVGEEVPISKRIEDQILEICQHIYPLSIESKKGIGDKLMKLFPFAK
jgi:DNA-binding NarL/FixJ family response regulator